MRKILIFLALWLVVLIAHPQKIVKSSDDIKKPKNGKLYFFEDDNRLTIYVNEAYFTLFQAPKVPKPTDPDLEPEPPQPVLKETVIGYWDSPDRLLALYPLKGKYYLMQKGADGYYYVARGINLLSDYRTVRTGEIPPNSPIDTEETELGGLMPPSGFPESEFLKLTGRVKNPSGEYVLPSNLPDPEPGNPGQGGGGSNPEFGKLQGIPKYPLPSRNDWTNFEDFENFKLPEGIVNVGGYGFPLYNNEGLHNGKLAVLQKGYSNLVNLGALPRSTWEAKNSYGFNQLQYLIKVAARNMIASGKNGGQYGDIASIANLPNDQHYIPYQNVTIEGAIELGRHLWYTNCCGNSIDNPNWDILQNEAVMMFDEESMTPLSWKGGDHYSFMGYLTQGYIDGAGKNAKLFWYAQPIQRWFQQTVLRDIQSITKQEIEASFSDSNILMNTAGWKNSVWYVDANGAYSKIPFLSGVDIYQKSGGKIATDATGKRIYRKDNFNIKVYNDTYQILPEPHEWIKYSIQHSSTGEMRFGAQYFNIRPDGASIKDEYVKQGFVLPYNGLARPNPSSWEPETKMWVEGIYRRADGIMSDLLALSKLEKGKYDLSKANSKYRLYGEHRPQTEPWTFGGNSIDVREIGESQIFYDTYMLLYSGGLALSTWDDGFYRSEVPNKGNILYSHSDYWGRYHSRLAAVQNALKPLEGTKVSDWTYVHFYYPYWGQKNAEVISSGIYYKGKLYLFFLNPTLENGERQTLTLKAGSKSVQFDLVGHEFYTYAFDAGEGFSPRDFKLSYTTIYGRKVTVNGEVTNKIDSHYE